MSIDYIARNPSLNGATLAGEFSAAQKDLERAINRFKGLKDKFDHNAESPNFGGVATIVGASGNGDTIYNATAGFLAAVNISDVNTLLHRIAQ